METSQVIKEKEILLDQSEEQRMNDSLSTGSQNRSSNSNDDNNNNNEENNTENNSEEEIKFIKQIISSSLNNGIPNCLLSADYSILMTIINNFFVAGGKPELGAASAFFTVYYTLLMHTTNLALNDTQGILGSRYIGLHEKKDVDCDLTSERDQWKKPFLIFKQSVVVGLFVFTFFCLIPSFFYATFLEKFFGVDGLLATLSQDMVVYALPGMMIRTVNDCLKTYLQNYKQTRILGYCYAVLVFVFGIVSAFVILFLKIEASSTGVILFFFEIVGLMLSSYFLMDLKKKKIGVL